MTTTHDNNATTWRELAEQLTPEQVAPVASCKTRFANSGIMDDPRASAVLMDIARDYATGNVTDMGFPDVPVPVGAEVDGSGWMRNLDQPGFSRFLMWRSVETNVNDVLSISLGASRAMAAARGRSRCMPRIPN
jgi:hypothetical protein